MRSIWRRQLQTKCPVSSTLLPFFLIFFCRTGFELVIGLPSFLTDLTSNNGSSTFHFMLDFFDSFQESSNAFHHSLTKTDFSAQFSTTQLQNSLILPKRRYFGSNLKPCLRIHHQVYRKLSYNYLANVKPKSLNFSYDIFVHTCAKPWYLIYPNRPPTKRKIKNKDAVVDQNLRSQCPRFRSLLLMS